MLAERDDVSCVWALNWRGLVRVPHLSRQRLRETAQGGKSLHVYVCVQLCTEAPGTPSCESVNFESENGDYKA